MPAYSALVSGGAVRPPRATCLLLASFAAGSGLWLLVGSQKEEQPDVASPRTQRSARSAAQLAKWFRWQAVLASEAAAHTASPGKGSLALWGDSITESWRGTSYGTPAGRANGTPAVLAQTLARRWPSPAVLAISGDQTQHLLWRLGDGGELPPPLASDGALTAVVMIGTNNLGAGHLPGPTAEGVLAVAREYLRRSRGRLLLCALLPRGDGAELLPRLCPPRCDRRGAPFRSFMPAVEKVNQRLREEAGGGRLSVDFPGRVSYVDCGGPFRAGGGRREGGEEEAEEVVVRLMPDRLHPNPEGHRLLARCLETALLGKGWGVQPTGYSRLGLPLGGSAP